MKSYRVEIFWTEKVKIVQYIVQKIDSRLNQGIDNEKLITIEKNLKTIINQDKKIALFMGISLKFSSLFPFPTITDIEIEQELNSIRDMYPVPRLPTELDSIYIHSAKDIEWESKELEKFYQDWKNTLVHWEKNLISINEKLEGKLRYFSVKGIRSILFGINASSFKNLYLFEKEIQPKLKS